MAGADDTEKKNTENVETDDTPDNEFGDAGDHTAGVLNLTSREGDVVWPTDSEDGVAERSEER